MLFDNLEYLSVKKQTSSFPKHYHETFCISFIHDGIELISLDDQNIYSEKGCITITNPYEIHSNPLVDVDCSLDFDTIYIPKDVMKYFLGGKNVIFYQRKINDVYANYFFSLIKEAIDTNNASVIEPLLMKFINRLKIYSIIKDEDYCTIKFNSLIEISAYIDTNISNKFNLDELAKIVNLNKYSFIKRFKATTGMTPMNYILMHKIFSAKKLITSDSDLTQIAFDYEFSDLAHFSNTFKRYIGVSPKVYQKNNAIIL